MNHTRSLSISIVAALIAIGAIGATASTSIHISHATEAPALTMQQQDDAIEYQQALIQGQWWVYATPGRR